MATRRAEIPGGRQVVQVAILAKAPIAGLAKTRLIPALGPQGAARLQRQLTRQAVQMALEARVGPVTLWCAPDTGHRFFRALHRATGVACRPQPGGDLGDRMHAAFLHHTPAGPLLLIGTDCPPLTARHLQQAADLLRDGAAMLPDGRDAVFYPAEDGGYALVGLQQPQPSLFRDMAWSTASVMADTRARARAAGVRLHELDTLWDLDLPEDLARLSPAAAARLGLPGTRPPPGVTA